MQLIPINHEDPQERADQVRMMGDIYKMAKHALVWLGPSFEGSDRGMNLIGDLGNAYYDLGRSARKALCHSRLLESASPKPHAQGREAVR